MRSGRGGWRSELVDAAVRRHERLATRVSVGMVGHAQALHRLLHPALTHLVQMAIDTVAAAEETAQALDAAATAVGVENQPTSSSNQTRHHAEPGAEESLPLMVVALRALLRGIGAMIRALRRLRDLVVAQLHADEEGEGVESAANMSSPTAERIRPDGTTSASTNAAPRILSRLARLLRLVRARLRQLLASTLRRVLGSGVRDGSVAESAVSASQYASFLLFAADVATVLYMGSFPEEVCLGLKRHPFSELAPVAASSLPRLMSAWPARALSPLYSVCNRAGDRATAVAAAAFRAWLRTWEEDSPVLAGIRDAVELAALVASGLQLRSFTSVDAMLFSAGITDAATTSIVQGGPPHVASTASWSESESSRMSLTGMDTAATATTTAAPAATTTAATTTTTSSLSPDVAATSAVATTMSRQELEAWIAEQQRAQLLQSSSPARQFLSMAASTVFAALPSLAISALPRIVSWLQQRQDQQQQNEGGGDDAALGDGGDEHHDRRPSFLGALLGVTDDGDDDDDGGGDGGGGDDDGYDGGAEGSGPGQSDSSGRGGGGGGDVDEGHHHDEHDDCMPSPHATVCRAEVSKAAAVMNRCALCEREPVRAPCVVPTAGLMCCYACAVQAVRDANNRCPFTGLSLNPNTDLISLYQDAL
ncbi:hypothetical protein PTSG_04374 [Salpingoeca rosetta]|uniref:Uncharacterized protein n=1 Tax=Salpingoeca rosetta (strain ATCC 50818 / BSB-021) TaxID=946362 RepID=F2U8D1_SALR5|nr:uncharacterized protein PTSG_04374 [Salpingoeca rosetta]EGD72639.1 hypothetical protein PTSG_04374 [Salpingoeca rosetta]|eukprot:XP_004994462.1 hypothetical protein PTSG_04374 [Salpingoeca rosetta]